jgi:glycosyltransferase involved in cell wall biosynthesis
MACGTPCVVSDLPWLDGMVRRGVEAVAVPLDAGAVAAAIAGLLADGAAVGERARALVQRDQDAREHQRRWLALYERLSARSTAAR